MDLEPLHFAIATRPGLTLTWLDGGGVATSYVVWRIDGRVVAVVEAGQA